MVIPSTYLKFRLSKSSEIFQPIYWTLLEETVLAVSFVKCGLCPKLGKTKQSSAMKNQAKKLLSRLTVSIFIGKL